MNNNIDGISRGNNEKKEVEMPVDIWLVDDDRELAEFMDENIQIDGKIKFKTFLTADEALKEISAGKMPDIVLVDGNIAGSSFEGAGLVTKLNEICSGSIKPVICAFTNQIEKEKEMLEAGADFALSKKPDEISRTCVFLSDAKRLEKIIINERKEREQKS